MECEWTIIDPNPQLINSSKIKTIKGFFDENFSSNCEYDTIIHSHLTKGIFSSIIKKWRRKYKLKLTSQPDNSSHLVEYKFLDDQQEEIKL